MTAVSVPVLLGHLAPTVLGWGTAAAVALVPVSAYLIGVARLERRVRARWSRWRTTAFILGYTLVAAALSPLFAAGGGAGATGHMVQHLLLGMYAPVALVLGAPVTLALGAAEVGTRRRLRRALTSRPVRIATGLTVVTALNAGGLFVLYLTPLYALSERSDVVHHLVHVHFVVAGSLFAWAVAGIDPSPHRAPLRWRLVALIAAAGAHNVLAKLLFARAPALPPAAGLSAPEVERAAQWMYWGGHLAEVALVVVVFATSYRRSPRTASARATAARTTAVRPAGVDTATIA